jgi:hypothetical protein
VRDLLCRRGRWPAAAIAVVAWLACACPAAAQTGATIEGLVRDTTGASVPGVTVTARHVETGAERVAVTEADGAFRFPSLRVGQYELRAEVMGFRSLVQQDIRLAVGETQVFALVLELGQVDEQVTVSGQAPAVNTRTTELSYLVDEEAVGRLPLNGRNYTDLSMLQPGVAAYAHRDGGSVVAHGVGMTVNGQDPRSNVYLLDGTLLNDFTNGPAGSAAGTALGLETVREFRIETNAYAAEFGRNFGGQLNVITKSGTNAFTGSGFGFYRDDAFDARNFFDTAGKPAFWRHQFGVVAGGPVRTDRLFFFAGYEGLQERLGLTRTAVVPDEQARNGLLPDPARPGQVLAVGVDPAVRPFLDAYPRPNGPSLGGGLATHVFPFAQRLSQHYGQGRVDLNASPDHQLFARYTADDARQRLPFDYPQFPRRFESRNQFFTAESRRVASPRTFATARVGFSRTRIGQQVESDVALAPFVPARALVGNIDIGGIPGRFGPQTSAWVRLVQNVFSGQYDVVHSRGAHTLKAGALVERYQMNMVNPTFALGVYSFPSLRAFLENRPATFIGLRPEGAVDRYWRSTLVGVYGQDEWQVNPRLTLNAGLRYEFMTMPRDIYGRDSSLIALSDREPTAGRLFAGPSYTNVSPRAGLAWAPSLDGRTSVRAGYGLYYNTNNNQNLIVTVTNPPATPRVVIANPTFPQPPFDRGVGNSIRPVQWDLETPRLHMWNVSLQRDLVWNTVVTLGYAGSRGRHLLRSSDVNTALPDVLADGTPFIPAGRPRQNTAFSTIELKTSDGNSWYRALIVDLRRRFSRGLALQSSYTWSSSEDTTQASTFFSDATNGTTAAFPEYVAGYNRGPSDFDARHNWVFSFSWDLPVAANATGFVRAALQGWQLSGIGQMRSGNPLTVFVAANRSRSLWQPSLGPGIGRDRPSYAPGYDARRAVVGRPDQWFDPNAFVLPPAGTFGNTGRGDFTGPDLRTFDLALTRRVPWQRLGSGGRLEVRLEVFNVFNRANFAPPALTVFSGQADNEPALPTFGRIRSTVTSARQVQIGVRFAF